MQCLVWYDPLGGTFITQSQILTNLKKEPFENIVGKGGNAEDI